MVACHLHLQLSNSSAGRLDEPAIDSPQSRWLTSQIYVGAVVEWSLPLNSLQCLAISK